MASPAAALEKAASAKRGSFFRHNIARTLAQFRSGRRSELWARQGAKEATTDLRGMLPACAFSVGPRWEWQCSNPTRRPTPTCWRCRRGRSWLATTAFSACWVPAASASPISPTRRRWRGSSPSRNIFPPTTPPAAPPAKPRRARKGARKTTSGGSTASSRRRRRSPASFIPTSSASTATSSPTTPATWCSQFEEGGSFKAWLKGLKRAPRQPELDRIVAPLLDALEIVHKGDYLHRDIAPDNIIIRKDGSPVLIDFGSARGEIASHSKTVSALVKPGYSPYEQYATTSQQAGAVDRHLRARRHALSRHHRQAPARCALAHGQRRVRAGRARPRSAPTGRLSSRDRQGAAGWRSASGRNRSPNGAATLLAPEPKRDAAARPAPRARSACARALEAAAEAGRRHRRGTAPPTEHAEPGARCRPTRRSPRASSSTSSRRLKKHRPALAAKKAPPAARPRQRRPPAAAAGAQALAAAQFGLGYGPPREPAASVPSAGQAAPPIAERRAPVPAGAGAPRAAAAAARAGLAHAVAALALACSTSC